MQKWQYQIICRLKNGDEHIVHTYSKHFEDNFKYTRKQKRMLKKGSLRTILN